MKKVLITGKNSYIGKSLKKWLEYNSENYLVDCISLRDPSWRLKDFSVYEVIYHVAGLAHIKETKKNKDLYYSINRNLSMEVATKAKHEKVAHFIFLSSMSVYGKNKGVITSKTIENPKSYYGKSKFQAEKLIKSLEDDFFRVAIVRPPMVYGKGCKGNYKKLSNLAKVTPIFPNLPNKRSMIYIDNLSKFTKLLIDNRLSGYFFPQNDDYVCTVDMVKKIRCIYHKKILLTSVLNFPISLFMKGPILKMFGDLVYDKSLSYNRDAYNVKSFEESIRLTEVVK